MDYTFYKKWLDGSKKKGVVRQECPIAREEFLNLDQKKVYDYIVHHSEAVPKIEPLRLIVTGTAGSGKSFLILCLSSKFGGRLLKLAPTGIAAMNIGGKTIHSALKIPIYNDESDADLGDLDPLKDSKLNEIRSNLTMVDYIIIDEFSMVGKRFLQKINQRLQQVYSWKKNEPFGGMSIIMIGDLAQLPPIYDYSLWRKGEHAETSNATALYATFTKSCKLEIQMRQEGNLHNQLFYETLLRIRDGTPLDSDIFSLQMRTDSFVSTQSKEEFSNVVHLYQTNERVNIHNGLKLKELGEPTFMLKAHVTKKTTLPPSIPDLFLAKKCRVILTRNLWVDGGLYNGALGTVHDILMLKEPVVLVKFDKFNGETLDNGVVPILPSRFSEYDKFKKIFHNFKQLPLRLAYGMTIHKSQGLTLPQAVIQLGIRDYSSGQGFVALSRVKSIFDLLIIDSNISRERFTTDSYIRDSRIQEEERLRILSI